MRTLKARRFAMKAASAAMIAAVLPFIGIQAASAQQGGQIQYSKATATNRVAETPLSDGRKIVSVWSDAMAIEVPNIVQAPANGDAGAPVFYLLNGAGGGEDSATWQAQSDVKAFMADKNVWTVTPVGGAFSYYTDWQKYDPNVLTRFARETDRPMKWETFLANELPFQFERTHGGAVDGDRKRAIAAISMTATSVLTIAENHPGRFQAIGSYSGCAETSTPIGHQFVEIVSGLTGRGKADLTNMWGPFPGPGWTANDPVVNAWKLKENTPAIYVSTGNGLPGPHENLNNWRLKNSVPALANQAIIGGLIEAATQYCTANLARKFAQEGIPAHFNFRQSGTHSWGYWQDDLHQSWPMIAGAIGA